MLIGLTGSASAETFTAPVVGVTDGDTLTVLRVGRPEIIRLRGIDAPERGQPYGERAKQYAATLAFGRVVVVEAVGRDRYGRLLAEVHLPDGRSLNQELIRAGLAWWFRRYSADSILATLETEARAARRGLWADRDPRPPWDYRQRRNSLPGRSSGPRRPDRPGRPGARAGDRTGLARAVTHKSRLPSETPPPDRTRVVPARPRRRDLETHSQPGLPSQSYSVIMCDK